QVVDANRIRSRFSLAGHPQVVEMVCPHCLKEETFNIRSWTEHAGRIAATEEPCPRCGIPVLFMNLLDRRESPGEGTLYAHPDPVGRNAIDGVGYLESLSAPLGRAYQSALKHYNQAEWGAAALTIRHLLEGLATRLDRKSTRLNSSHVKISYAVFCLKKKTKQKNDKRAMHNRRYH